MDNQYPLLHAQVAARIIDGQAVIVLADSGEVQVLNSVGTRIWELIDGTRSVKQIAQIVTDEFAVDLSVALPDTRVFVKTLLASGAVELKEGPLPG